MWDWTPTVSPYFNCIFSLPPHSAKRLWVRIPHTWFFNYFFMSFFSYLLHPSKRLWVRTPQAQSFIFLLNDHLSFTPFRIPLTTFYYLIFLWHVYSEVLVQYLRTSSIKKIFWTWIVCSKQPQIKFPECWKFVHPLCIPFTQILDVRLRINFHVT